MPRSPLTRTRLSLAALLLAATTLSTGCDGSTPTGLPSSEDAAQLSAARSSGRGTTGRGVEQQSSYAVAYRNSSYAVAYRNGEASK